MRGFVDPVRAGMAAGTAAQIVRGWRQLVVIGEERVRLELHTQARGGLHSAASVFATCDSTGA